MRFSTHAILALAVCFVSNMSWAGGWNHSASLSSTLDHDTNMKLSPVGDNAVSRLIFSPSYLGTAVYGIDEFRLGVGLKVERPSNRRVSLNREDPNFLFGWRRQLQSGELGFTAKYDQVSTLISELEETGLVVTDSTRKTTSLGATWSVALNERHTLATNAEYKQTSFDGGNSTNFENLSAGLTWSYAWSERISPYLRFSTSHYQPDSSAGNAVSSDNHSLAVGVTVKASDRIEWSVQAGSSVVVAQSRQMGWQGRSSIRYLGDGYDVSAELGRSVVPSSAAGGFVETDQARIAYSQQLGERSSMGLNFAHTTSRAVLPSTLQSVGASMSYVMSPLTSARLTLQHRSRQQDGQPDAKSDVLGISLVFSHPDL